MVKTDQRTRQVREVRHRLREGPPWTRDHERDFETVTVPERDCDLLRDLLISEGAGTVVEVGLAYGSSALAIGEALVTVDPPRPRHVIHWPVAGRQPPVRLLLAHPCAGAVTGMSLIAAAAASPLSRVISSQLRRAAMAR
jgi:hypothetical protein